MYLSVCLSLPLSLSLYPIKISYNDAGLQDTLIEPRNEPLAYPSDPRHLIILDLTGNLLRLYHE